MAEPFLNLGDIRFVIERVGRGRRAQGVHAQTVDLGAEARLARIFADDVFQDRRAVQRTVKLTRAVVCHWPEEGTGGILAV